MQVLTEDALKARLAARGVRVPTSFVVGSASEVAARLDGLACPVMVKALVPLTNRARRGLVVRVERKEQVEPTVRDMLGVEAGGRRVTRVLVEECAAPGREHYLATAIDYARGQAVLLYGEGGSGIEQRTPPQRWPLDDDQTFEFLPEELRPVASALVAEFTALRPKMIELNPVRTDASGAVVLDAKASLDPSLPAPIDAIDLVARDEHNERLQALARSLPGGTEVRFGRLDGTVGLVSAGGGVLAVVHDALRRHGLRPANFADVSGGAATTELLGAVAREVVSLRPQGILVVTGITSSITVTGFANAVLEGLRPLCDQADPPPIVARMAGPGEHEAAEILSALPRCTTVGRDVAVDEAVEILARTMARGRDGHPA